MFFVKDKKVIYRILIKVFNETDKKLIYK